MQNNWEPRVGQKVVALRDFGVTGIKKGHVRIVSAVKRCKCGRCHVDVSATIIDQYDWVECVECGKIIHKTIIFLSAKFFAPISEQYADMTSEIAQQFKEHPDTVDQPVKVLEVQN